MQNTFTNRTDFLRHSLASRIAHRAHNLEPDQIGPPKRVFRYQTSRSRCHATPHRRRSNPIAQIRKSIRLTYLIDPAASQETPGLIEYRELIGHALLGNLLLDGNPLSSFVERVALVAPRHPGIDLGYRLQSGCVHVLCVPLLIQTYVVVTHVVVSWSVERRGSAAAGSGRTRLMAVRISLAAPLLDHLIRSLEQRRRDGQPEGLGGLEVDHEFELGRLLDG